MSQLVTGKHKKGSVRINKRNLYYFALCIYFLLAKRISTNSTNQIFQILF